MKKPSCMKKALLLALGLAALVLNPFYACSVVNGFSYDAGELRAAVEGTWVFITPEHAYTFQIEQAGTAQQTSQASLIPSAHACGSRTLVNSAHACIETTTMPLVVKYADKTSRGSFEVYGSVFSGGHLTINIDGHDVYSQISKEGIVLDISEKSVLVRTSRARQ
jgi:hypothetical protein